MKHGKGAKKRGSAKKTPAQSGRKAKKSRPARRTQESKRAASTRSRSTVPTKGDLRASRSAGISFNNALVGNAFRRAVKKYSTALKRLTD